MKLHEILSIETTATLEKHGLIIVIEEFDNVLIVKLVSKGIVFKKRTASTSLAGIYFAKGWIEGIATMLEDL